MIGFIQLISDVPATVKVGDVQAMPVYLGYPAHVAPVSKVEVRPWLERRSWRDREFVLELCGGSPELSPELFAEACEASGVQEALQQLRELIAAVDLESVDTGVSLD